MKTLMMKTPTKIF